MTSRKLSSTDSWFYVYSGDDVTHKFRYYPSTKECWVNADCYLHRLDGPARLEFNTDYCPSHIYKYIMWYKNGRLHRLDGPALERVGMYKLYYIEGVEYNVCDYYAIIDNVDKENINDVATLNDLF